jgi:hypothetical protein
MLEIVFVFSYRQTPFFYNKMTKQLILNFVKSYCVYMEPNSDYDFLDRAAEIMEKDIFDERLADVFTAMNKLGYLEEVIEDIAIEHVDYLDPDIFHLDLSRKSIVDWKPLLTYEEFMCISDFWGLLDSVSIWLNGVDANKWMKVATESAQRRPI